MISDVMQAKINDQISAELYSAYLYLAMSADFSAKNLSGCAKWMQAQAQEEMGHAQKFYQYLLERDGRVELKAIPAPPQEWSSPLEAFEASYGHEQEITGLINELSAAAEAENDRATQVFLQWFINEQVEEESSVLGVVEKLRMLSGAPPHAMFMLDAHLAQR